MEQTETQVKTFNNDAPEQEFVITGSKEKLPKFTLPRGERLRLSLDQIGALHGKFFNTLTELKEGGAQAPAELRSIMESVISLAYSEELEKLREASYIESIIEEERQNAFNDILTPHTWRRFFRTRRNQSQVMLNELVRRQVKLFLEKKAVELPTVASEAEEKDLQPFEVVIDNLLCSLPRLHKKRGEAITELIGQLCDVHNSIINESKRLAAELEEVRQTATAAEERAQAAEKMLGEFLQDSQPEPDEAENEEEQPKEEPEEGQEEPEISEEVPEEEHGGEEGQPEPADEEESEGLSYDGLGEE